jgi:hypothetical protein
MGNEPGKNAFLHVAGYVVFSYCPARFPFSIAA